jgi:hypothetical protein
MPKKTPFETLFRFKSRKTRNDQLREVKRKSGMYTQMKEEIFHVHSNEKAFTLPCEKLFGGCEREHNFRSFFYPFNEIIKQIVLVLSKRKNETYTR